MNSCYNKIDNFGNENIKNNDIILNKFDQFKYDVICPLHLETPLDTFQVFLQKFLQSVVQIVIKDLLLCR